MRQPTRRSIAASPGDCNGRQSRRQRHGKAKGRGTASCPSPGPQTAYIQCPYDIVVYGGARGGGKTFGALGEFWIHAETYGDRARGLMLRKTREDLKDTIAVAERMFGNAANWSEKGAFFRFNNGARLYCAYLENESDAEHYQGWSLTRRLHRGDDAIRRAGRRCMQAAGDAAHRARHPLPDARPPATRAGPGHLWVKQWTSTTAPTGVHRPRDRPDAGSSSRPCSPTTRRCCKPIPRYVDRLKAVGSPQLVRAWLEGDWNDIEGAFFAEWSAGRHVIPPFAIPSEWTKFRCRRLGLGQAVLGRLVWRWCRTTTCSTTAAILPRGALVRYREWYGMKPGTPNEGLKMPAERGRQGHCFT